MATDSIITVHISAADLMQPGDDPAPDWWDPDDGPHLRLHDVADALIGVAVDWDGDEGVQDLVAALRDGDRYFTFRGSIFCNLGVCEALEALEVPYEAAEGPGNCEGWDEGYEEFTYYHPDLGTKTFHGVGLTALELIALLDEDTTYSKADLIDIETKNSPAAYQRLFNQIGA